METTAIKTSFPKYAAYKDSGVEWLGEIPEGWEIYPGLKFLFENKSKNTGMKRKTVLSLSFGNIRIKGEDELTGLVPESFETYQFVNKGDLIFRPTDLQNDKVSLRSGISKYQGIITSAYLNLRFRPEANSRFYHYFFRAIDNNKIIYGLGSGLRQNISYQDFRRFAFPFPPLPEQTAIAAFLDDKTAKIDRVIAQKQQMIALLKERKQIIIQNAVTGKWSMVNGEWLMTPKDKMKHSGVEWIGEIPEGWEVKKLKFLLKIKNGQEYKHVVSEEGYPVIGSGGAFAFATDYLFDGEALLLGRKGTIDKPLYVNEKFWTVDTMFFAIVKKSYSTKYLYFLALTIPFKYYSTSTALPSMTQDDLNNHKIAIPSFIEQLEILNYLELELKKYDQAITLQQTQIEKLKEYKATLIDSAVTGKIKVG